MIDENENHSIQSLEKLRDESFKNHSLDLGQIKSIILILKNLIEENTQKKLIFANRLRDELFRRSIKLKELDSYINFLINLETKSSSSPNRKKNPHILARKEELKFDYFNLLSEIVSSFQSELESLKSYFIIKLEAEIEVNYELLILFEEGSFYESFLKRVKNIYNDIKSYSLDNFHDQIQKNNHINKSYIVILIYSEKRVEQSIANERNEKIKIICESFNQFLIIRLKKFNSITKQDLLTDNHLEKMLEEINFNSSITLKNAELTYYEEMLMKKFFKDNNCYLLEYKILKGGNSGSTVIEVRPKSILAPTIMRRYVIKMGKPNSKIQTEKNNFKAYIENYPNPGYDSVQHEENVQVEGLRYTYASSDTISNSYSFSEILRDTSNKYHSQSKQIIEKVFSGTPFDNWKKTKELQKKELTEFYSSFLDFDRFAVEVAQITGQTLSEVKKSKIFIELKNTLNKKIEFNTKVCHGDLHTDNFFNDDNNTIYLIDFGLTGVHHAIIDHISLECSIKFKHIPRYINIEELKKLENALLSIDSFTLGYNSEFKNQALSDYFEIILTIRNNSVSYIHQLNYKEYFISLFLMTCRQVMYKDMNQGFAYESALILMEKIVTDY
ncbi:phosphotransferase [Leptospira sp. 85282-16]|uniref:phosphotransferase n=1 Tax=Leptospira sp. 85282-16 TaxID=2971256 RepID=UPI0021C0B0E5|nr:phosphotransferase [Leptospira sp. 85282-16]MCT8334036.1 phosphotransferase [Leptospira sp. 85282-16]